jgi:hypothetical protein
MRSDRPFWLVAACFVCLAAVILGPLVAAYWNPAIGKAEPARAKLQLWLATVSVQALCWTFLIVWMAPRLLRLYRAAGTGATLLAAVLPTLILATPWIGILESGAKPIRIAGIDIRPYVMGRVGLGVAALGLCGLFLEYRQTLIEAGGTAADRIVRLGEGLARMHQFLFASAVVLGLGTVGASALRGAILTMPDGAMPQEYVAIYGILGSLLLLAAYAPVRFEIYRRGEHAIAEASGEIPRSPDGIKQWTEARAAMESLLGQDPKSWFGLSGVLSSLLPLVLGSIGKLLEK